MPNGAPHFRLFPMLAAWARGHAEAFAQWGGNLLAFLGLVLVAYQLHEARQVSLDSQTLEWARELQGPEMWQEMQTTFIILRDSAKTLKAQEHRLKADRVFRSNFIHVMNKFEFLGYFYANRKIDRETFSEAATPPLEDYYAFVEEWVKEKRKSQPDAYEYFEGMVDDLRCRHGSDLCRSQGIREIWN